MVKLDRCRILVELEGAHDVSKVVVLILQQARNHLGKVCFVLLGAGFVGGSSVATFLDDASGIVEGAARDVTLLRGAARPALNIE